MRRILAFVILLAGCSYHRHDGDVKVHGRAEFAITVGHCKEYEDKTKRLECYEKFMAALEKTDCAKKIVDIEEYLLNKKAPKQP